MKKFTGKRKLFDIKAKVLGLNGSWFQEKFDQGSDHITFILPKFHGRVNLQVIYNTLNGRFIVPLGDGVDATESSTELDGTKWYDKLLELVYITDGEGK